LKREIGVMQTFDYDIALSFAGEDRIYADDLANRLKAKGLKVFYDIFEQENLWGKNLYDHLSEVYSKKARYCLMFLSAHYAKKAWTNLERKSAQERAFRENSEYILPVRLDDTQIPGIYETIGYIDLRTTSILNLSDMVLRKLNLFTEKVDTIGGVTNVKMTMPRIRKTFSTLEKDNFLKKSFEEIKFYFKMGLEHIQTQNNELHTDFEEITKYKFICKIYFNGDLKCQCKIWVGGMSSSQSISYSEGTKDPHQDNSLNESLTIESDGFLLYWKALGMDIFSNNTLQDKAQASQAAEYLWVRFIRPLSY
jgi:hypothetical protein